ncbi:MAG: DMT family transporter [Betaproteobacteria bacterium]
MKRHDLVDLLLLATLWGGSFLFMRIAVPAFGPLAMVEVRVAVASLVLVAIVLRQRQAGDLIVHWWPLTVVGAVNSAIPFTLFGYALLSLSAGFGAILNATAPLFGAVIAFLWLHERLPPLRIAGLVIGFSGVTLLVWGKPSFQAGGDGWAIFAVLCATISYGIGPNYAKRNLGSVPPLVIATGSQIAAALLVLPLAVIEWPAQQPGLGAWLAVIALGVACTGFAYILYFRLIANIGPSRAIAVTFLIPAFGMLWGALFLGETVTLWMVLGCAVILVGTALATGVLTMPAPGAATTK